MAKFAYPKGIDTEEIQVSEDTQKVVSKVNKAIRNESKWIVLTQDDKSTAFNPLWVEDIQD